MDCYLVLSGLGETRRKGETALILLGGTKLFRPRRTPVVNVTKENKLVGVGLMVRTHRRRLVCDLFL
jgi:hypothetical protein